MIDGLLCLDGNNFVAPFPLVPFYNLGKFGFRLYTVSCGSRGHYIALTMSKKSEKQCSFSSCSVCLCQINTGKRTPFFHSPNGALLTECHKDLCYTCMFGWQGRITKNGTVYVCIGVCLPRSLSVNCTATQTLAAQDNWISNFKAMHNTLKSWECIPSTLPYPHSDLHPKSTKPTHTLALQKNRPLPVSLLGS